jgi:large subunit ribosomal protein L15
MNLHELAPEEGINRGKRRVGRGHGSGRGKTSGRGTKGQNSRAGGGTKLHHEGGQNPWTMRIPHKRGFNIGRFRKTVQVVNLRDIERTFAEGDAIDLASLKAHGLVNDVSGKSPVKLLGEGALSKRVTLEVHHASRSALAAVEAAGGTVTLLRPPAEEPAEAPAETPAAEGEAEAETPAAEPAG